MILTIISNYKNVKKASDIYFKTILKVRTHKYCKIHKVLAENIQQKQLKTVLFT